MRQNAAPLPLGWVEGEKKSLKRTHLPLRLNHFALSFQRLQQFLFGAGCGGGVKAPSLLHGLQLAFGFFQAIFAALPGKE